MERPGSNMKKSNFDFGSHWSTPKRFVRVQESADRTSEDGGMDMGFRMAHDSSDRGYIGSRWFAGPNHACTGHIDKSIPELSGNYLGFRLTREDT